jgi:hypothetical protein
MDYYVIMHNMIIENEREESVEDDHPYDHDGPLAQLDQVSVEFCIPRHASKNPQHRRI